jgi:flagellin
MATQLSNGAVDGSAIGGAVAVTINDKAINASTTYGSDVGHVAVTNDQDSSAYSKAKAINATGVGVKANASETTLTSAADFAAAGSAGYTLSINGTSVYQGSGAADIESLVNQINTHADATGVTASVNGAKVDLTAADGRNINLVSEDGGATNGAGGFEGNVAQTRANITLTSTENISIGTGNSRLGYTGSSIVVDSNNLNTSVDLTTRSGALGSIDRIDSAIESVLANRGRMGAVQNRLETTSSNLASISENVTAAKGRIRDADFAAEAANMTRNQILQQAASAMLSQANSSPNMALQLLR